MHLIRGPEALPPPEHSDARGLVAVGGDLRPERLLDAYRRGIFPWYEEGLPILWHSPDPRMVLRTADLRVGRSLRKRIRRGDFEIRFDTRFREVIEECARVGRPDQDGTWITRDMIDAYVELHELGWAHSAEAYVEDTLVGGLYGVCVGGVFCGESMFAHRSDASKVAFVWAAQQLAEWGVELIDCQVYTEHLDRFGATEWPRARFLAALAERVDPAVGSEGGATLGSPRQWRFDPGFEPSW